MEKSHHSAENLEEIWHQVPPDYYQKGVQKNLFQRIWHKRKLSIITSLVNSSKATPKNILDVGCASGWFLKQISIRYPSADCTGVDVYKKAIDWGKNNYKSLKLICADAHNLPLPNESFDLVICTEVLEHVVEPEKVLKEINRVLTSKGIAIIEMDTGNLLFRIIWYWWNHLRHGVWKDAHIHTFNTEKLERLIIKSGFSIVEKKMFNATMAVAYRSTKKY